MKEQFISYDTAALAKAKRFEEWTSHFYPDKGVLKRKGEDRLNGPYLLSSENRCLSLSDPKCDAPTQSLLQKWLREEYNIHIVVYPAAFINDPSKIIFGYKIQDKSANPEEDFESYEEALEEALKKALLMI